MRPKKNPNNDLNQKRGLYFVLGLVFILVLIYIFLEWKTVDDNHGFDIGLLPNKEIINQNTSIVLESKATK